MDTVAKVENRTTPKISQKLIFGLLCDSIAFQSRQEGPWSILEEAIQSLTSPRVKRISGSKNFRSTPQKDFCNNIHPITDITKLERHVRKVPTTEVSDRFDRLVEGCQPRRFGSANAFSGIHFDFLVVRRQA
jgi:hypothetical protein